MQIITNNAPRNLLYAHELTEKELKEFDYYSPEEMEYKSFFRYKGYIYCLDDFMTCPTMAKDNPLSSWHGYHSDSYFSGIVVKYIDRDYDKITIGRFYC